MPYFSVIIPVYNRKESLCKAIDSVLDQNFNDFELIVVDDGSTDDTSTVKGLYSEKIRYIRLDTNHGVSFARNSGIKESNGKYIALLDSDDTWLKEKLQKDYYYINAHPSSLIHQSNEIWIRNGKQVNPGKKHIKRPGYIYKESLELCLVSPSSVVIAPEIFRRYGFFDERMKVCEDYDLWLRIARKEKIGLIEEYLIVKYGGHSDQLSRSEWGMDRFRVYSLIKLLNDNKISLTSDQEFQTVEVLNRKIGILLSGAIKRNNIKFKFYLEKLKDNIINQKTSSINFSLLLEE